jgi:hypothetical protein
LKIWKINKGLTLDGHRVVEDVSYIEGEAKKAK